MYSIIMKYLRVAFLNVIMVFKYSMQYIIYKLDIMSLFVTIIR